jgi:hypothetical protein
MITALFDNSSSFRIVDRKLVFPEPRNPVMITTGVDDRLSLILSGIISLRWYSLLG